MQKYITVLLFVFATVVLAQTNLSSTNDLFSKCPNLQALDRAKYQGVEWIIGSSTKRFFLSTSFQQISYLNYPQNADLATLSRLIESRGSHLIMAPIPTKGMFYQDICVFHAIRAPVFTANRAPTKPPITLGTK
jgi:hypothetical protein